ncbi:hypothetical protein AYI69_g9359 [Smittium culicis]|uniref:Uncharacterized protein n=1 Tax=Smittium culicis TaxID=133412 RepID=A0A1R1XD81_9FUNG|nr:hypothetical protein AYI69_g9359 [Smittium culicis]
MKFTKITARHKITNSNTNKFLCRSTGCVPKGEYINLLPERSTLALLQVLQRDRSEAGDKLQEKVKTSKGCITYRKKPSTDHEKPRHISQN